VVGGGVVQIGSADRIAVAASGPLDASGDPLQTKNGDKAVQWEGALHNSSGTTRTFRVFALCASHSAATIKAKQFSVPHNSVAEAFAKCGRKKRAVGGGVVQIGTAISVGVHASGPLDASGVTVQTDDGDKATQWYAAVVNQDSNSERTFKVFAICEL
jgi:hypothetical protein